MCLDGLYHTILYEYLLQFVKQIQIRRLCIVIILYRDDIPVYLLLWPLLTSQLTSVPYLHLISSHLFCLIPIDNHKSLVNRCKNRTPSRLAILVVA
jgi:hypothetical protein